MCECEKLVQLFTALSHTLISRPTHGLFTFYAVQMIAEELLKQKARDEKLAATEEKVRKMDESNMRKKILDFLKEHPEYCDSFME